MLKFRMILESIEAYTIIATITMYPLDGMGRIGKSWISHELFIRWKELMSLKRVVSHLMNKNQEFEKF